MSTNTVPGRDSTDQLADKIAELVRCWSGGDPERLADAYRILSESEYLGTVNTGNEEDCREDN